MSGENVLDVLTGSLPYLISDNCPSHSNADQADVDGDGMGDVCGKLTLYMSTESNDRQFCEILNSIKIL